MMIFELPEDLVEEILCRVPATSLKKVRSTCKRWNGLFNDSRMVRKHCDKAAKEFMLLMLTKSYAFCPMSIDLHEAPSLNFKCQVGLLDQHPLYNDSYCLFDIYTVFHCDGLLVCISDEGSRIMIWNPFTHQTRLIQSGKNRLYFFGYSQDRKSRNKSFKILSCSPSGKNDMEIYELSSDSWRTLHDDDNNNPGRSWEINDQIVCLKGNTYWFDKDKTKTHLGVFLSKFDFSTEKLGRRVPLPYQCQRYRNLSISVVKEEKISVSLQRLSTSKTEIWVTNEIDETKGVSWSKVLALDLSGDIKITEFGSFLLDEEKKVVVCCERWFCHEDENKFKEMIYIVGEDNEVTQFDFGVDTMEVCRQSILNYTPSLVQVERVEAKEKDVPK